MINSELCRFVLNHYEIPYTEAAHIFGWASLLALWYGRTVEVPVVYGNNLRLAGPRAIVARFDPHCPAARKLIPPEKTGSDQIERDWNDFNWTLGGATAAFAYYHLLPHRQLMIEPFTRDVPAAERWIVKNLYALFAAQFKLLLQLSARHANEAARQIKSTFDSVDRRLADGRQFLLGDTLTLSDLALATAAAPVLLPEGYGAPMPLLAAMPPEMTAMIEEMRQHETARFVQRIFGQYRNQPISTGANRG
jgi:glutathione S-transferase